jgi:hypothetical protein
MLFWAIGVLSCIFDIASVRQADILPTPSNMQEIGLYVRQAARRSGSSWQKRHLNYRDYLYF